MQRVNFARALHSLLREVERVSGFTAEGLADVPVSELIAIYFAATEDQEEMGAAVEEAVVDAAEVTLTDEEIWEWMESD